MSSLSARDLLVEASHGIGSRPGRLVLTILGTVLGIAAVVVTLGMAQTGAGQIAKQFDAVAATQAVAQPATTQTMGGDTRARTTLPWNSPDRVLRLNGIEAAALLADVDVAGARISAVPVVDPTAPQLAAPAVVAASSGLLDAVRGTLSTGRLFDAGHDARGDRVVVLGAGAAERLGVNRVDSQPSIFIGERAYTVIGILGDTARRRDLLDAVILPLGTARADFGLAAPGELQMRIDVGAGSLVSEQVPIALSPNTPENVEVSAPPTGGELARNVRGDINVVFLALGAVALIVGGLGIANVTLLSVMERVGEIGLRRALGATRAQVAAQFIVESVVVGLLGGLIGSALGVFVVVGVSAWQDWTPIVDLPLAFGSALLGGVIGLLAGAYPAIKAASLEPVTALRGGSETSSRAASVGVSDLGPTVTAKVPDDTDGGTQMGTNDGTNDSATANSATPSGSGTSATGSSRERDDLVAALDRHHGFLLQTTQGLDEAQLRARSSVSEFTLAALLKLVAETEESWAAFARDGGFPGADEWASWAADTADPAAGATGDGATSGTGDAATVGTGGSQDGTADVSGGSWGGDWGVTDEHTLPVLTSRLAEAAAGTRELVRTLDLDREIRLPDAPWFEAGASWTVRRVFLHVLAEVSQHAGHADIIREGIDGARTIG